MLRRGLPTLTAVGMLVGALLALAFSLQERAQFELPPLPRRSKAPRWNGNDGTALAQAKAAA